MSYKPFLKQVSRYAFYAIPVSILASTFLPLRPVVSQAMIGILLIWFQVSLMLGMFSK